MNRARCPICGKPQVSEFHPFCSARCADVDLNRWLTGSYSIAGSPEENDVDQEPANWKSEA
ncbi:MAG TPA: DNA gyrase inhibitor YacG [Caulobacteraceae bacterium]|nr:DNA gyrase inhibitor YacG [Caulobacteraceae bacterium]